MNTGNKDQRLAAARKTALGLLARREHGRAELLAKLRLRGYDASEAGPVIDDLSEQGLQSDHRYAEALTNQRRGRGYGPLRVSMELRSKEIDQAIIDEVVRTGEPAWEEAAKRALAKKFGQRLAGGADGERDRVAARHWLRQRGFSDQQARTAVRQSVKEDTDRA